MPAPCGSAASCAARPVLCSQPTDPLRPREGPVPRVHRTGPGAAPE
ncbi:MAG: hypothetical protein LBE67_02840 [Kocuria palustris]|nr:hypothetical protein [Kocuria palustris]